MGRGTARRAVEGQGGCGDRFGSGIDIGKNFGGWNVQNGEAQIGQRPIAPDIAIRPIAPIMRLPVNFDNELGVGTIEVGDVARDRMLAAKLRAPCASAKPPP